MAMSRIDGTVGLCVHGVPLLCRPCPKCQPELFAEKCKHGVPTQIRRCGICYRKPYEVPDIQAEMHLQIAPNMSEESRTALFGVCAAAYRKLKEMDHAV